MPGEVKLTAPQEAYRRAIGDERQNELFDRAMEALHQFAQATDALAGTDVIHWFAQRAGAAAEASFEAYRQRAALATGSPDAQ